MKRARNYEGDGQQRASFSGARTGGYTSKKPYQKKGAGYKKKYFSQMSLPGAQVAREKPTGEVRQVDTNVFVRSMGDSVTAFSEGSPQTIAYLNLISAGPGYYQREGSNITLKSLTIRAQIEPSYLNPNAVTTPTVLRVLIIYDKGANGTLPVKGSIFRNTNGNNVQETKCQSYLAPGGKNRFVILRDNLVVVNPIGVNGVNPAITSGGGGAKWNDKGEDGNQGALSMNWHIPLKYGVTSYSTSSSPPVSSDISVGSLFICMFSDEATANAGEGAYLLNVSARLKYWA